MDAGLTITVISVAMFVGSLLLGFIPLLFRLSEVSHFSPHHVVFINELFCFIVGSLSAEPHSSCVPCDPLEKSAVRLHPGSRSAVWDSPGHHYPWGSGFTGGLIRRWAELFTLPNRLTRFFFFFAWSSWQHIIIIYRMLEFAFWLWPSSADWCRLKAKLLCGVVLSCGCNQKLLFSFIFFPASSSSSALNASENTATSAEKGPPPRFFIGVALTFGFTFMFVVDQIGSYLSARGTLAALLTPALFFAVCPSNINPVHMYVVWFQTKGLVCITASTSQPLWGWLFILQVCNTLTSITHLCTGNVF